MRKHLTKILSLLLVAVTLVSMFAIPASAAGYYMACTIYYKDESGNQVASTKTFSMNAADTTAQNKQYASPSVSGYTLKNSSDAYVTYLMMDKSFGSSHYTREGSATYTVYYVKNASSSIYYNYANGGTAYTTKTVSGRPGNSFTVTSPSITGYTPNKSSVTGTYGSGSHVVTYYEKSYTVTYNANGGSGAPGVQTKKYFTNLKLSSTIPTRTGYSFGGWGTILMELHEAGIRIVSPYDSFDSKIISKQVDKEATEFMQCLQNALLQVMEKHILKNVDEFEDYVDKTRFKHKSAPFCITYGHKALVIPYSEDLCAELFEYLEYLDEKFLRPELYEDDKYDDEDDEDDDIPKFEQEPLVERDFEG